MFRTHINKAFSRKKGFTLVEMLIVVVIIGVLASALIPRLLGAQSQARDVARKKHLSDINSALMMLYNDKGRFSDGNCSFHLDNDYMNMPGEWGYNNPSAQSDLNQTNLVSGGYISDIPRDPQKNKNNPRSDAPYICANGYYLYRAIIDEPTGIPNKGFILGANMENYKNLNYVFTGTRPLSPNRWVGSGKPVLIDWFNIYEATFINSNKCDSVIKGTGLCQTNSINSGVYLLVGYPGSQ